MANRVYETMTSVQTETGWSVRVWWTTASFEACYDGTITNTITETVRANATNPETIRAAIEAVSGAGVSLTAFEIKDRYGNGGVVYPDWN